MTKSITMTSKGSDGACMATARMAAAPSSASAHTKPLFVNMRT
jgi:hypothetical protein